MNSRKFRRGAGWAALAGVVLGAVGAVGVSARQAAPSQPPPQSQPTFRTGTTVVEVDVIVRDKAGRFVTDLRAEDFEVRDEGKPVEVSTVYRVVGPGDLGAGTSEGGATPLPAPTPQQVQRVLVFLFDRNSVQPGGFEKARKAAIEFLANDFRQGDVGGVVSGGTMVNQRLSSSREELEAALRSITPSSSGDLVRELREWPRFVDIVEAFRVTRNDRGYNPGSTAIDDVVARACRDRPDDCAGRGGADAVRSQCQAKANQLVAAGRLMGKQTLDTISALANGLARLPGRKTIVLLTEGFFVEDSWADLRTVVGRAARASVRIYALDTRGLNRGSASSDIFTSAYPSQPEMSAPSLGDTNADGPNSLAVDTGGYVVRNENDFGKAFKEIDRDTSSYYVVGFRTPQPPDGKYHGISVRVNRAGVAVRARKGYLASAEPSPTVVPAPASSPGAAAAAQPVTAAPPAPTAATEALPVRSQPRIGEAVSELTSMGGAPAKESGDAAIRKARSGWEAYQKGDVKTARAALGEAARSGAAPPWVHYVLGWSLYAGGEYGEAGQWWERVRGAVPEFEPVYFDLVDSYLREKEYGRAVAILREAETRWPKDIEVLNALGVVQLTRGAVDDAVVTFEKAVALDPSDAGSRYNLGKTYEVRAIRSERVGKVGPGAVNPQATLDDRQRAIDCYRQVVALGGPLAEAAREGIKRLGLGSLPPDP